MHKENRQVPVNNTLNKTKQIDLTDWQITKVIEEVLKKSPNRETLIQRYNLPYDAQGQFKR